MIALVVLMGLASAGLLMLGVGQCLWALLLLLAQMFDWEGE